MKYQTSDSIFTVNSEAAASIHDEGIVILHTGRGCLFSANRIGARIWCDVEQQKSLEAITEEISSEYQIPLTTAREHLDHFLAQLQKQKLILREGVS